MFYKLCCMRKQMFCKFRRELKIDVQTRIDEVESISLERITQCMQAGRPHALNKAYMHSKFLERNSPTRIRKQEFDSASLIREYSRGGKSVPFSIKIWCCLNLFFVGVYLWDLIWVEFPFCRGVPQKNSKIWCCLNTLFVGVYLRFLSACQQFEKMPNWWLQESMSSR